MEQNRLFACIENPKKQFRETIENLKRERLKELAEPEKSKKIWLFAGYFFAFFGGLLGLFMGLALVTHKKTLPNGEKVYGYTLEDRKHGNRITIMSLVFMVLWFLIGIFGNY